MKKCCKVSAARKKSVCVCIRPSLIKMAAANIPDLDPDGPLPKEMRLNAKGENERCNENDREMNTSLWEGVCQASSATKPARGINLTRPWPLGRPRAISAPWPTSTGTSSNWTLAVPKITRGIIPTTWPSTYLYPKVISPAVKWSRRNWHKCKILNKWWELLLFLLVETLDLSHILNAIKSYILSISSTTWKHSVTWPPDLSGILNAIKICSFHFSIIFIYFQLKNIW